MDFTREPILESVITPKEGCKLVVRSSKGACQEEFFVDSVEVVSFGSTFFLRSLERPKTFLVPASDYEILEVRETRMVLKNVGLDRSIKIRGGREGGKRKAEIKPEEEAVEQPKAEPKLEKRRERRRHYRKRRGKEESDEQEVADAEKITEENELQNADSFSDFSIDEEAKEEKEQRSPRAFRPLLPPPSMLISESIEKYKGSHLFKGVFYTKEEEEIKLKEEEEQEIEKEIPDSSLEELSEEEESAKLWDEDEDEFEKEEDSDDVAKEEGENPVGQNC